MSKSSRRVVIGVLAAVLLLGGTTVAYVYTRNTAVTNRDESIVVDGYEPNPADANGKPAEASGVERATSSPADAAGNPVDVGEPPGTVDAGEESESGSDKDPHGIRIMVITTDGIDQHWVALYEGAQKAAYELGVTVQFRSPNTCDDTQPEFIGNAIEDGFDAILIAPRSSDALSDALSLAISSGVKLVYVDSPANVPAEATFRTDNTAAGKTAGEQMRTALEAAGVTSGKIGIVNVNSSTSSVVAREAGFREVFAGSGFEILETQYGEGDAAKSQTIAENYVTQGVVGIFGANEGSAVGAGNAIKASGNSAIVGVGFDKSDAIMNLISEGWLKYTLAQNPDVMGYEGVKAAVAAINGHSFGGEVFDTGVSVLTK